MNSEIENNTSSLRPPPQRIRIFKIANTFKTLKTLTFLLVKIFWITIKNDATYVPVTYMYLLFNKPDQFNPYI